MEQIVEAAHEAGVHAMITVGCTIDDATEALRIADQFASVYATAGIHPHDASQGVDGLEDLLAAHRDGGKLVAVGECGLDYHYDHSPRDIQRNVFARQINLAHQFDLPLMIHTRSAWDDTFAVLDEMGVPERTVFHCFTGGPAEAEQCLERGAWLSFSGIVTFPSAANDVAKAAELCPDSKILIETDSPYLAPVPHRGKVNLPALVPIVGAKIAEIRKKSLAEIAELTWENAHTVYGG